MISDLFSMVGFSMVLEMQMSLAYVDCAGIIAGINWNGIFIDILNLRFHLCVVNSSGIQYHIKSARAATGLGTAHSNILTAFAAID